ncbi:uncharacterized protein MYCFIDRAFT_216271 [Pseudocercospora fijiensis CIRAD86]|uniref:Heterokaryon incompatibility domain-containing protein n=1 Tax=Pseudocercospora fijiensis (strain CIRAD86) TaxID=383855 RepID=M3AU17_PSEFD|nr:uncharacterized protein MYCFIDRAFT_216271 [Pseudocercospora fijiensis CIRAD86]EME80643.1 hypothetical protein MYCFIDRAFT_216271 [Pseudocercospora fijiensis CIRAD86]
MALMFGTGGFALASWGFSVGDIAALAGAGRKIGTWLTAHLSDRALFDWTGTDVDALFTRRGILDVEALQRRWDREIILLQNGHVKTIETTPGAAALHRMDRWTWLMTLFTAALEAAVSSIDLRSIMNKVLLQTVEEWEESSDFLLREGPSHIAGWRSAACLGAFDRGPKLVGVARRAGQASGRFHTQLGKCGDHIFSLAILLEELGVLLKTTENSPDCLDGGSTVIYWNRDIPDFSQYTHAKKRRRAGMRIPLAFIEEAGSLFPNTRNEVGQIMQDAIEAVHRAKIDLFSMLPDKNESFQKNTAVHIHEQEVEYTLSNDAETTVPRLEGDELRFIKWFLLKPGPAAVGPYRSDALTGGVWVLELVGPGVPRPYTPVPRIRASSEVYRIPSTPGSLEDGLLIENGNTAGCFALLHVDSTCAITMSCEAHTEEKNIQVQVMAKIFSKADEVLI